MILKILRAFAILEGISYLLLFALSMPLKYWGGIGAPNIYIGYAHGVLFIGYMVFSIISWRIKNWSHKTLFYLILASFLPFGTFYVEEKFLKVQ
ncbi:MAG: hypothetical protein RLZZ241_2608 [Bacteroidota bacterium]|jgi:integral membrane protein